MVCASVLFNLEVAHMSHANQHKAPVVLQLFRYGGLVFFLAMIVVAPLTWYLYWAGYRQTTIDALNSSASYRDDPGRAEAATWHIAEQWPWLFGAALVLFLMYLYIFRWSSPSRGPQGH
jgi:hypothetical protein